MINDDLPRQCPASLSHTGRCTPVQPDQSGTHFLKNLKKYEKKLEILPGVRGVGQLDEGRHLRHADHLQQLHVETQEEVDRLLGDSCGSDGEAVLLTVGESKSVVNL